MLPETVVLWKAKSLDSGLLKVYSVIPILNL
jgi:hypothetical protein